MKLTFKKDRFLIFFFISLAFVLFILLCSILFIWQIEKTEILNEKEAQTSLVIAQDMRQSSDDLTKMMRLYVLTSDKKYLDYYFEILSIRNGTSPRPINYDQIYWDFVLDNQKRPTPYGKARSLKQIMIDHGFSKEEMALIEESQKESDTLVSLEVEAMNAMEGRFNNGSGDYTVIGEPDPSLARALVSGPAYMSEKAKIMKPLLVFSKEVKERLVKNGDKIRQKAFNLIIFSFVLSVLAYVIMIVCILKAFRSLKEATQTNEGLLLNMLPSPIADRLKKGEHSIRDEFQASVLFVNIRHFTEAFSSEMVTKVFDRIHKLSEDFGVEKIKILGETYMIVSGIPIQITDHEERLANFSLALKEEIVKLNEETGLDLALRIGMASGTVIAGIVGSKKFIYDLWGDVVTLAAFLESSSEVGHIQISEEMAHSLHSSFDLEERGLMAVKGKKPIKTYFLLSKKQNGIF